MKKKILLLHSSSDMYGASKIFVNIIETLQKQYDVFVVLSSEGELTNTLKEMNIQFTILNLAILRRKYYNIKGLFNRFYYFVKAFWGLKKIVYKYNIDLIYSNTTAVLVGALVALFTKRKHVYHIHEIIEKPKILKKILNFFINKSLLNIVVSKEVLKCWTNKKNNIKVIYNGIDASLFEKPTSNIRSQYNIESDTVVMATIGRINFWKGQKYFVDIAENIIKNIKNVKVKFLIFGNAFPGYEFLEEELKDYIRNKNIQDYVVYGGYRSDIVNILHSIDLFVLPSIQPDPLPTTVLEAMCCKKPVIATCHGGALEMLLENKTGIFIPYDNSQEAAKKIIPLIFDKSLREKFGLNGYERVKQIFTPEQFRINLLNAVNEVLK